MAATTITWPTSSRPRSSRRCKNERPVIKQSGRDRKGYLYIKDTAEGLLAVAEGVAASRRAARRGIQPGAQRSASRVIDLVRTILAALEIEIGTGDSESRRRLSRKSTWTTPRPGNCSVGRRSSTWLPASCETARWFSESPLSPLNAKTAAAHP